MGCSSSVVPDSETSSRVELRSLPPGVGAVGVVASRYSIHDGGKDGEDDVVILAHFPGMVTSLSAAAGLSCGHDRQKTLYWYVLVFMNAGVL